MFYFIDISTFLDLHYLTVFLIGIFIGFLLLLMIYLYSLIKGLRKKVKYKKHPVEIDELELEKIIAEALKDFKNKKRRKEVGLVSHFKIVNLELINDIAKMHYPNSKYPLLELNVQESLDALNYISLRIKEMINKRFFSFIKKIKIASVLENKDKNSKKKEEKDIKKLFNFKRYIKPKISKMKKMPLVFFGPMVIKIIGEETYKIYSKSVFKDKEEFKIFMDELYYDIIVDE